MRSGFTLVELIATFSIIVIIALGVFIQFRSLSSTQTLENGLDIARSIIQQARTNAITAQTCCGLTTPPNGYGVSITIDGAPDNEIIWFADIDNDQLYSSSDTVLSSTTIDDVNLTSCDDGTTTTTSGDCTVIFQPPGFSGLYYNKVLASDTVSLTFTEASSSTTQSIVIYPTSYVIE